MKQYWTTGDVAQFFGQSPQTIIRWDNDPGKDFPPSFRNPANRRRWVPEDIITWAETHGWPVPAQV